MDAPLDALRRWDAWLSVKVAPRTRTQYRRLALRFLADTLLDPWEVQESDVIDYLAALSSQGAMRGQVLRALMNFYAWAEKRGLCTNPCSDLTIPKEKYGPAPTLSREELTRLLIAAAWREPRRAWAILLMYCTGARIASFCALTPDDVRDGVVYFREAKGSRPYAVPLGPMGREAAKELANIARGLYLVGVKPGRFWQWVRQASDDSGVRAWPHLLRHSFATHHLEAGTDVRTLQELGNWADLSQIPRYTAVTDPRKRQAQERF